MNANALKKGLLVAVPLTGAVILLDRPDVSLGTVLSEPAGVESANPSAPSPYRSSVVGTDFDFITENDPDAFKRLEFVGFKEFEMPDNGEPANRWSRMRMCSMRTSPMARRSVLPWTRISAAGKRQSKMRCATCRGSANYRRFIAET